MSGYQITSSPYIRGKIDSPAIIHFFQRQKLSYILQSYEDAP